MKRNKFKFNKYPKGIYNLINLSLPVCKHADDQIWLPKHVGGISQCAVEKCGLLIYVNDNELRHRMMLVKRLSLAGHVKPQCPI